MIGRLKSKVQYTDIQTIAEMGLNTYLTDLNKELFAIGDALNVHYFAYN
jgi:uncharacterized alpha-E superfamily protein